MKSYNMLHLYQVCMKKCAKSERNDNLKIILFLLVEPKRTTCTVDISLQSGYLSLVPRPFSWPFNVARWKGGEGLVRNVTHVMPGIEAR